eukprot:92808-Pelagomonas_calceolata.AAC.6
MECADPPNSSVIFANMGTEHGHPCTRKAQRVVGLTPFEGGGWASPLAARNLRVCLSRHLLLIGLQKPWPPWAMGTLCETCCILSYLLVEL